MAGVPSAVPGLVFRCDFLRPWEAEAGIEHGKERPACILMTLKVGERLSGVTVIAEDADRLEADYAANDGDVIIVPIHSDPPGLDKLGVVLDELTKRYIGLPGDRPSYALVSEVNVDPWPNAGIQDVPGRLDQFAYPRTMPGPKLAEIAKAFRLLRDRKIVRAVARRP